MTGISKEYIEKEKLCNWCFETGASYCNNCVMNREGIPAANVRENVKGKWTQARNDYNGTLKNDEWYGPIFVCSVCGEEMLGTPNFCPNCGAKMGGYDG